MTEDPFQPTSAAWRGFVVGTAVEIVVALFLWATL